MQLSREDLRELAQITDLGTMEILMQLLVERSAKQLVYSNLAQEIQVAVDTVKRWIGLLGRMHYGFIVRPWFVNEPADCFKVRHPVVVPAKTFLSQLL